MLGMRSQLSSLGTVNHLDMEGMMLLQLNLLKKHVQPFIQVKKEK